MRVRRRLFRPREMTEMNARREIVVAGLLLVLCSGCAVGPNYKKPAVPVPPEYRGLSPDQSGQSGAASFGEQKWWDAFQDEALSDLIRTSLKQNYDVRIAAARILEARAQFGIHASRPVAIRRCRRIRGE